eukprot:TRINITY_DN15763_c0_g1_i8.p1 TRINITY_DN15763_c0_g1~~TRINITY_DN15763_c0_g1_i8.p1  ORF type:complete len:1151 (+),score=176.55 TRINITY_DN15763_c0_g1_i8:1807-5259(+)
MKLETRWNNLVTELVSLLHELETDHLKVYLDGDKIETFIAMTAVQHDMMWAVGSYLFVCAYATVHTRSALLAQAGLLLVLTSIPVAVATFKLVSGSDEISLMMLLSIFICIGVGSDMLFVYTDFWKQSLQHTRDPVQRLRFTYKQASASTAATTFTTCMSFMANLLSSLRPLREFGFFMGVCVVNAWLLMFLAYPALLVVGERVHRQVRSLIKLSPGEEEQFQLELDEAKFRTHNGRNQPKTALGTFQSIAEKSAKTRRKSVVMMASMLDPEKKGASTQFIQNFLGGAAAKLEAWRHTTMLMFAGITGAIFYVSIMNAEQDTKVPSLFREDHPRTAMKAYEGLFNAFDVDIANQLGDYATRCADIFASCDLHECKSSGRQLGSLSNCECFPYAEDPDVPKAFAVARGGQSSADRRLARILNGSRTVFPRLPSSTHTTSDSSSLVGSSGTFRRAEAKSDDAEATADDKDQEEENPPCARGFNVQVRFLGREGLSDKNYTRATHQRYVEGRLPPGATVTIASQQPSVSHIFTEHWDSGLDRVANLLVTPVATAVMDDSYPESTMCTIRDVCYCGLERCDGAVTGPSLGAIEFISERMRLPEERGLQSIGTSQAVIQANRDDEDDRRRLEEQVCNRAAGECEFGLQPTTVRLELQADVIIVFGIKVVGTQPPLGISTVQPYEFTGTFRLEEPWAQRKAIELCDKWPRDLNVVRHLCWIQNFRTWWVGQGEDWPVRLHKDFHSNAHKFATSQMTNQRPTTEFVWFDASQRVIAMYFQAYLGVSRFETGSSGPLLAAWNEFFKKYNQNADPSYEGVWHASRLWSGVEAQAVIMSSTINTLMVSLGCVLLGVCVFTGSLHLACIVMLMVTCIVISLLFFMVIVMNWKIGALEVLSLIVFVGFAVDYCLHISHKYHSCHVDGVQQDDEHEEEDEDAGNEAEGFGHAMSMGGQQALRSMAGGRSSRRGSQRPSFRSAGSSSSIGSAGSQRMVRTRISISDMKGPDKKPLPKDQKELLELSRPQERFARTKYALERMGGAVVGSALTTIGCALFLMPCILVIFTKIGLVVIGVTMSALLYTMIPLPAMLMTIGPCSNDMAAVGNMVVKAARTCCKLFLFSDERDEDVRTRRYVLNMPSRAMSDAGPGLKASRTKITATG